jgi:hypothetical protein
VSRCYTTGEQSGEFNRMGGRNSGYSSQARKGIAFGLHLGVADGKDVLKIYA